MYVGICRYIFIFLSRDMNDKLSVYHMSGKILDQTGSQRMEAIVKEVR